MSTTIFPHFKSQNDQILFEEIIPFYENAENRKLIMEIIQGKSNISLRVIDHFVTNYALKHNIMYNYNDSEIYVHPDYKAKLKPYSKKRFDPFCRGGKKDGDNKNENFMDGSTRQKFIFPMENQTDVITRLCQLNFFRWAIKSGVIDYTSKHLNDIEKDMNNSSKRKRTKTVRKISPNKQKKITIKKKPSKIQKLSESKVINKGKKVRRANKKIQKCDSKEKEIEIETKTINVPETKSETGDEIITTNDSIKITAKSHVNKYSAHIFIRLD